MVKEGEGGVAQGGGVGEEGQVQGYADLGLDY